MAGKGLTASIISGSDVVFDFSCDVCADFDKKLRGFWILSGLWRLSLPRMLYSPWSTQGVKEPPTAGPEVNAPEEAHRPD